MAANRNPFGKVRIVIQRSSLLTKIVVLTTLVVCTAMLLVLAAGIRDARDKTAESQQAAATLEQENDRLEDRIDGIGSVEGDKQIAKDEFGLVDPNTVVITP